MTGPAAQEAPVWVLLTSKRGDNGQLLALAKALGRPYLTFTLSFDRRRAWVPPLLLGATLKTLSASCDWPAPPWPAAVLASGRRSVPVARWIRQQSGNVTRLIHLGRPWSPLSGFDLVVTTPQYGLARRKNVLENLLPFLPADDVGQHSDIRLPELIREALGHLPRPWTVALVGGSSRPYVFNEAVATRLVKKINIDVQARGGSVLILSGPRTPPACMDVIERAVDVPAYVYRWDQGTNPYPSLRHHADRFLVTGDSASMVSEALLTAKPVDLFDLPKKPDWRWRATAAWRAAGRHVGLLRKSFELLRDCGLLSSVRDVGQFHRRLRSAGLFDDSHSVPQFAQFEQRRTVHRVLAAIDGVSHYPLRQDSGRRFELHPKPTQLAADSDTSALPVPVPARSASASQPASRSSAETASIGRR